MRVLSILAGALFFTSCVVNEHEIGSKQVPEQQEGMSEISFMAEMPAPKVVATRAVGSARENAVDDIYVLVFETGNDGDLIYKGKGRSLTVADGATNNNKITFKATLPVGTAYDFMVLANAEDALSEINVSDGDKTKADVLELTKTLTTKWSASSTDLEPIPMWGELKNRTLTANSSIVFQLTRMLARVNVEYSPTNTQVNNFRLSSVHVYNYSTKGTLVPAAASLDTDGYTSKSTTEPDAGYGTQTGSALVYTDITGNKECKDLIYLFEAPHNGSVYGSSATSDDWIDNPCLVIGGKWSKDGTNWPTNDTYYRVDFIKKTTVEGTTTEEWLSLLRNFSYNVTITEVSGEGYSEPDQALHSAPFNMEANVLPWNERNFEKVVFDGVFYLSVSQDEFVFQRIGATAKDVENETNVVRIKTDYLVDNDRTNAGSGWRVDRIVNAGTETPVNWIRLQPNVRPGTWNPDDVDEAYFTFDTNPGPTNREADVWIKAGRLEYKVHIVQKIMSLDVLDGNDDPIEEMAFVIPDTGTDGTETRPFKVTWTPSGQPVTITGRNQANGAFDPAWIIGGPAFPDPNPYGSTNTPDVSLIPAQSGQVGEQGFTVRPAAVTTTMLNIDPFYETNTTYYFEVENSGETMTDSINLHQIHYDIKADTQKYRLDGGVHTLTVRSNANWEIVSVEEHLFNSALPTPRPSNGDPIMINFGYAYDNLKEGLHFGPNVNGTALAFHVVDNESGEHKDKWGTVWVTLKMTTPQGTTKTIRVALQFPPSTRLILGLGPGLDVRGYNIGIATPYHLNSANRMITSPYNFGSMDESVYKVEGLRVLGYNMMGSPSASPSTTNPDYDWHANSMKEWLNNHSPDVIVISSNPGNPAELRANEVRLLKEYMDNGGVVILCSHGEVGQSTAAQRTGRVLNAIYGTTATPTPFTVGTTASNSDFLYDGQTGQTMQLFGDAASDDPILAGPFGDIRGKHWGAHYYTTGVMTSKLNAVAPNAVALSTQVDTSGRGSATDRAREALFTTVFYDTTKRFMYIGNGCAMASYYDDITEEIHDPFDINDNMSPTFEPHFGEGTWNENNGNITGYLTETYNSFMIANAIAWALDHTNHTPPPAPGYQ